MPELALSAASRSFREVFISQVHMVTVTCEEDLALLLTCSWPLLSMVILPKHCCPAILDSRLAGYVQISAKADSHLLILAMFFMLRPLQTPD